MTVRIAGSLNFSLKNQNALPCTLAAFPLDVQNDNMGIERAFFKKWVTSGKCPPCWLTI
jgi:hypothetical protein